jgi:hypothetical protein
MEFSEDDTRVFLDMISVIIVGLNDELNWILFQRYELKTYFSDDFNLTTPDDIYLDHDYS